MNKRLMGFFAGLVFALSSPLAFATLIGDEVSCELSGAQIGPVGEPFFCNPSTAIASEGFEFTISYDPDSPDTSILLLVDILSSSIEISFPFGPGNAAEFSTGELILGSLNWVDFPDAEITGFELDIVNVEGLQEADITTGPDFVTIDMTDTRWFTDSGSVTGRATITLETNHAAVPEPTTLALLGIGLAGIGFARKKMKA